MLCYTTYCTSPFTGQIYLPVHMTIKNVKLLNSPASTTCLAQTLFRDLHFLKTANVIRNFLRKKIAYCYIITDFFFIFMCLLVA